MITSLEEPMLIIALESLDEDGQYRHIKHAEQGVDYYCPCCHEILRARAVDKNKKFLVQPHFYHLNGGCREESYIHWLCKTWMMIPGTIFSVNGKDYEVETIDIEKQHKTSYGIYQPDVTILTTAGETFYIEFFYSSQKNSDYLLKWDELGNVVLEANARQLVSQKYADEKLNFKIIYKDGYCYSNPHLTREYSDLIEKRKREWQRQDILNYKAQWEKLDWFWSNLCRLIEGNIDITKVLDDFKKIDISDKEMCYNLLSKHKVVKGYEEDFRKIINDEIIEYWSQYVESKHNSKVINIESYVVMPGRNIMIDVTGKEFYEGYVGHYCNYYRNIQTYKYENRKKIISYNIIASVINEINNYEKSLIPAREKHIEATLKHIRQKKEKKNKSVQMNHNSTIIRNRNRLLWHKNREMYINNFIYIFNNVKMQFISRPKCIWKISEPIIDVNKISFYISLKDKDMFSEEIVIVRDVIPDYNEMFLIDELMNKMKIIMNNYSNYYSGYKSYGGWFNQGREYCYRKMFVLGGSY